VKLLTEEPWRILVSLEALIDTSMEIKSSKANSVLDSFVRHLLRAKEGMVTLEAVWEMRPHRRVNKVAWCKGLVI
jgi:hypothetical protein